MYRARVSVLVAIGVGKDGYRKVLGIAEGHKGDQARWGGFLKHLKERGLSGVPLVDPVHGSVRHALT